MKIAAFTMGYNERVFLPLWIAHYGRMFGVENLFYLDHSSSAPVEISQKINKIIVPRGVFDEPNRAFSVSHFHSFLLGFYDVVVFSDTDEFLVADPEKFKDLRAFIEARDAPLITALGFDVLHFPDIEPSLDLTRPILLQRRFARLENTYCKTLIAREPLAWTAGFHNVQRRAPAYDPDLFLFHLKYVDRDVFAQNQTHRTSVQWSERSLQRNHGAQWRQNAAAAVRTRFGNAPPTDAPELIDRDPGTTATEWLAARAAAKPLYRIPDRFHDAIRPAGDAASSMAAGGMPAPDTTKQADRQDLGIPKPNPADDQSPPPNQQNCEVKFKNKTTLFYIENPNDHIQSKQKSGEFYEIQQLLVHQEVIPRGMVVLDIGANVGNHSLFYAQYSEASRIVPFEPNPVAQTILRRNVELNAAAHRSRIDLSHVGIALSDKKSSLAIANSPKNNLGGTAFREASAPSSNTIQCLPLDDLPVHAGIGFMKIDVEGMELAVLRGAEKTISNDRPIIYIEINKANEKPFWAWLQTYEYLPTFVAHNYPSVKNYLIVPKS